MLCTLTSHWVLICMNNCHSIIVIVLNTLYRFYSSPIANNRKTDHTIQSYFIFQFPEILSLSFSTILFRPLDRALAYKAPSAPSSPPQPGQEEVRHAASLNFWIVLDILINRFCWELIRFSWSHTFFMQVLPAPALKGSQIRISQYSWTLLHDVINLASPYYATYMLHRNAS